MKDIHSPCIIEVSSSVNFEVGYRRQYKLSDYKGKTCLQARSLRCHYLSFDHTSDHFLNFDFPQIHPEEVEDGLDKQEILIIWNFVVNTSMSVTSLCSLVRRKYDDGWEEEDEVEEEEDVEDESLPEEEIGANLANKSTDSNFVEFSPSSRPEYSVVYWNVYFERRQFSWAFSVGT